MTTQNADIANCLIDKNAWLKLNPLRGCYESTVNPHTDDVPQDTGHYEHPTWRVAWSLRELEDLVESRYDERMLTLIQIEAGMGPTAVLVLCAEVLEEWNSLPVPQEP